MLALVNYRIKVTLKDTRYMVGHMLAYDKHMNLVLSDCEEFRLVKRKKSKEADDHDDEDGPLEMKRTLGLVILRGEAVVSISVEGPPPIVTEDKVGNMIAGPGRGAPAGRGMGMGMMPQGGVPPPMMRGAPMPFRGGPMPPPGMGRGYPPGPPGFSGPPPGFPGGPPPGFSMPPPGYGPQ